MGLGLDRSFSAYSRDCEPMTDSAFKDHYHCHAAYWPWGTHPVHGDVAYHRFDYPLDKAEAQAWFDRHSKHAKVTEVVYENSVVMRKASSPEEVEVWNLKPRSEEMELRNKIEKIISARTVARRAGNWVESDRLRDELSSIGIAIKDNLDGSTTWESAR